jgi:hypothetical protein
VPQPISGRNNCVLSRDLETSRTTDQNLTFYINYRESLIDVLAPDLGTGRHNIMHTALIFLNVEFYHSFLIGYSIQLGHVDLPQMLNKNGTALYPSATPPTVRCHDWFATLQLDAARRLVALTSALQNLRK